MTPYRLASLRPAVAAGLLALSLAATACSTPDASATPDPATPSASAGASATPPLTPEPTPSPEPTPRYTNPPDAELAGLFPETVNGAPLVVPPSTEFALTPGDFGAAYGEIGVRFASLATAYVAQPRLTIYAARVDGDPVATEDLEPHLATAGRYVGIAGLDAEPWELTDVDGQLSWVRPEDNATALGTMIYTWSSGEFVFLLIGTDDAVNRALVAALPGEPAPSPTPTPTPTPSASPGASDTGAGASPSPSPSSDRSGG
jgi:hypothetical protein